MPIQAQKWKQINQECIVQIFQVKNNKLPRHSTARKARVDLSVEKERI